ncbi:phosphohistidine phosphatase SixA [Methylomarinum sp. Ch1-1]|uniref:Phosphohistidine phosphatase SixA n=1 Tax=Methylomarinum roseum TaxID=3067653 RepID=A0AAU7NZ07_9GAMM|nr:phosphohistidine phosphatase SixA [Methylomarinum sp. Ch1-1]MDP4521693.1 phosphohistidine phosphatase SixA [Methylomarinum sp. Ch1-1]
MNILLVQHGKCFAKEADPDRSLTVQGREEVIKVAGQAVEAQIEVGAIFHSGKLRALQTAELFAQHLNVDRMEAIDGIAPLDDVEVFAQHFQWPDQAMLVGHLPFMARLAAYLLTGRAEPAIIKFQHGGIVCLEQNEYPHWALKWTMMPLID